MARFLAALTLAAVVAAPALAEEREKRGFRERPPRGEAMSPEFDNVRKALEALTPEQRKRFHENFLRWSNLSPEEKKALHDRGEFRRKRMTEEIDTAIRDSGLQLEKEQREQFARRYIEERRKIEAQLRQELEAKRGPLLQEMVGRVKSEFAAPAASTAP